MKKNMHEIRNFFKIGLYFGVSIGLFSCAGDQPTASTDTVRTDEQVSVRAEETGEFGGNVEAYNDMFNRDLSSTNYYETWDMNRDRFIDENEYSVAFFDTWDINDDNIIDENEWNTARNDFGLAEDQNWALMTWDTNRDRKIDQEEFRVQIGNTNMFKDWDKDRDNRLSEKEYSEGVVGLWNKADADGMLDEKDYKDKHKKYYKKDKKKHKSDKY